MVVCCCIHHSQAPLLEVTGVAWETDQLVPALCLCRTNAGRTPSPAPNGFTDLIPAGLTYVGPVVAVGGAPTSK